MRLLSHKTGTQFFIYLPSPSSLLLDETPNVGTHWEKQDRNRKAARKEERELTIITECHFGGIMRRSRTDIFYNGVTSHRLHNHNTKFDIIATYSSRPDRKRADARPKLCSQFPLYDNSFEKEIVKLDKNCKLVLIRLNLSQARLKGNIKSKYKNLHNQ